MIKEKKEIKKIHQFIMGSIPDTTYIFLFVAGCLGLYLNWPPIQIIIFLLLIWAILKSPNGWQIARWSLVFFVLAALAIVLKKSDLIDQFSLGAIIFLFFSIIKISVDKS